MRGVRSGDGGLGGEYGGGDLDESECDGDLVSGAKGEHDAFHGAQHVAHAICMTDYYDERFRGSSDLLDGHRHYGEMRYGGYSFD